MFVYEKMWVVAGVFVNIGVRERSFMFVYEGSRLANMFMCVYDLPVLQASAFRVFACHGSGTGPED